MIYHVVAESKWKEAVELGFYEAPSLVLEGFIHLSTQQQVAGVLDRYYQGQKDLLILHVEESRLSAPLKYEISPSVSDSFPHLFGKLNIDAVVNVTPAEVGL